jgi:hypothetical protein
MKRYWEQLKPQERRWAVGIGGVVFLLLNWFFVWPYRGAWGRDKLRMEAIEHTNQIYSAEVRHKAEYIRKISEMQSEDADIPPEEQAIDFIHFFTSRALNNRVLIMNQGAVTTRTNEFFLEQALGITVQADETNLVNFLYSLGSGNSMMRVRAMSLHPEPSHQQLSASITLVASYRKKAPARSGNAPVAKPVAVVPAPAAASIPVPAKPAADTRLPRTLPNVMPPPPPAAPGGKPGGKSVNFQATSATNKPVPSITKKP